MRPRPRTTPITLGMPVLAFAREVIAVGASTGGPPVVLAFLRSLPHSYAVPILVTQHMPAQHMPYFIDLLARQSGRLVVRAEHGAPVIPGTVYVAQATHLGLARRNDRLTIKLDDGPEENNCKPAVDPMFRSVAEVCRRAAVGVVMTGMGCDGAAGAALLRAGGAPVLVQDEASSVVWGMPGAVVAAGQADAVAPGAELADWVARWTANPRGGRS
jgi:two-component system chemotaxis response regulator CheB